MARRRGAVRNNTIQGYDAENGGEPLTGFRPRNSRNTHQPERLWIKDHQAAARLIQNGKTVLLLGGSTGAAVARELGNHTNLTLITNSLLVANELVRQGVHKIIMLGGTIDADELAVRGTLSRTFLSDLQVDKVVLGTKAISPQRGLSAESAEGEPSLSSVCAALCPATPEPIRVLLAFHPK